MKAFIEYVAKGLVDHPEEVDVREIDGERAVIFELRLNQTDIGKVIGKSGRTITAIRTLLWLRMESAFWRISVAKSVASK